MDIKEAVFFEHSDGICYLFSGDIGELRVNLFYFKWSDSAILASVVADNIQYHINDMLCQLRVQYCLYVCRDLNIT